MSRRGHAAATVSLAAILAALAPACPAPVPGEPDASLDGGDAGPIDAGLLDAGPDAGFDAGLDAGPDAGNDAGAVDGGDGGHATGSDGGMSDGGDAGSADGGDAGPVPVTFSAQVIDFCNNYTPLEGVQISVLGGGATAITDSQGNYQLPLQAGVPVTQVLQLTGYQTSYLGEVVIDADLSLTVSQIPLVCNSIYQSLTGSFSNLNANEGVILAKVYTLASTGPCTDQAGWTFQISPSGGESYAYFDSTGSLDPALTATQSFGVGVVYNIAGSRVFLSAQKPDAGCTDESVAIGLTGYMNLAPGILSLGAYFIQ